MADQLTNHENSASHENQAHHDGITLNLLEKPIYFTNQTHEVGPLHIKPLHIPSQIHIPGTILGGTIISVVFAILALTISNIRKKQKYSKFVIGFDLMYEKISDFFEEILGENTKPWIKSYVITVFFVIFFSNILALILDFFILPLPASAHGIIKAPTTSLAYTLAMAICSIILMLVAQMQSLGVKNFFLEYFPLTGKGFLKAEKKPGLGMLGYIGSKLFDILISMFLGFLEIIGLFAKIISLGARLFGNMFAHGVLLLTIAGLLGAVTKSLSGYDLPVGIPVVIYLQGLLVGFIQAFVFALLVSIFIKVVTTHEEEHGETHA